MQASVSKRKPGETPIQEKIDGHFGDRLILRQRQLGHPLCVGLDPHLKQIPPLFRAGSMDPSDQRTTAAIESFLSAILDRVADRVATVKPQIAFFERLGWRGLRTLDHLIEKARRSGLLVLLDAKRGDIGSTAAGYAAAYLGSSPATEVDAMTLNPFLGLDSLEPFLDRARRYGRGLFILAKTSNPGSSDYQNRIVLEEGKSGGLTLFETVATSLAGESTSLRGPDTGWSSLGIVAGATYPRESERLRELLPHSLFLVPGYGAQGGDAKAALAGFVPGENGRLEGGLVNSSRSILFPPGSETDDSKRWERAIDDALARSIDELSAAASSR